MWPPSAQRGSPATVVPAVNGRLSDERGLVSCRRVPASSEFDRQVREILRAGDTRGAATLVLRELGPEVLGFLSGVLGDADADEVYSAWSERLWRSLKGFEGRCSLRTWTYVLARREISRFRKGMRRHAEGRVPLSEIKDVLAVPRTRTRTTMGTTKQLQLTALRDELPIEDRTLLILRVDRKLSFDEIALVFAENLESVTEVERSETEGSAPRGIERSETEGGDPDGSAGGAGGGAPRGIDRRREAARLRKRFQLVKERLVARARRHAAAS
jgi:RNA polymerase sigma-70 factor, ECF subfamily